MTDGLQPSGTQACNISIRSVRRVRPIRRGFHHDPARMSEISAAWRKGERGPGRGPDRSRRNFDLPGRGKTCARPGMCKYGRLCAGYRCIYVRTWAASRRTQLHSTVCSLTRHSESWTSKRKLKPCPGGSCAVCPCGRLVSRSCHCRQGDDGKKAMCSMWAASQSRTGQTGKRRGGCTK